MRDMRRESRVPARRAATFDELPDRDRAGDEVHAAH
jgi:hypothetical protein